MEDEKNLPEPKLCEGKCGAGGANTLCTKDGNEHYWCGKPPCAVTIIKEADEGA